MCFYFYLCDCVWGAGKRKGGREKERKCASLVCTQAGMHAHNCRYHWRPKEGIISSEAGITGGRDLPGLGSGN